MLKYYKLRAVKSPTRGTSKSAGIDFYIPSDFGKVELSRGHSISIPSGLKVKVPEGYTLVMFNKSGVALKKGLQVGACVIDEDYQGEVHLHVTNTGTPIAKLLPGDKLVQGLLIPVSYAEMQEVGSAKEMYGGEITERGTGGFGSTGAR